MWKAWVSLSPHLHPWGLTDYTEGFGLKIDTLETRASPTSEVVEGEGEDPGVELEGKTLSFTPGTYWGVV